MIKVSLITIATFIFFIGIYMVFMRDEQYKGSMVILLSLVFAIFAGMMPGKNKQQFAKTSRGRR
jgi:hypothetical protein